MSVLPALDLGLAVLVLGVAAWTIAARNLFGAVVGYFAYGLLLAMVWVRLYAPDVALTEAAIGGGVTGVLLVTAATRLDALESAQPAAPPGRAQKVPAGALAVARRRRARPAVLTLPSPAPVSAPAAAAAAAGPRRGPRQSGHRRARSPIARSTPCWKRSCWSSPCVGVWSVAPDRFWGGAPAPLGPTQPDAALVFLARVLAPIGVRDRRPDVLGRRRRAGRRLPGRRGPRGHVDAGHDGAAQGAAADRLALASSGADRRAPRCS